MNKPLPSGVVSAAKIAQRLRAQQHREANAHRIASAAARADKTDPFTYDRVFSHAMCSVGEMYDYGKYRGGAPDESA